MYYRGEAIAFTELKEQPQKASAPLALRARPVVVRKAKKDHPWRQPYQPMRTPIPKEQIGAPLVGMRTYTLRPKLQGFASVRIPTTTSTTKRGHF